MLNIYIKLGTPGTCATCDKPFHIGQRVVTDGAHDFDTCQCAALYDKDGKFWWSEEDAGVHRGYGG